MYKSIYLYSVLTLEYIAVVRTILTIPPILRPKKNTVLASTSERLNTESKVAIR